MSMIGRLIRWLARDARGTAALETALITPPLIFMGMAGLELTNNVITQKKVTELANAVADNASRAGDNQALGEMPLRESDINDVLAGGVLQGKGLDIANKGRVIISSLEQTSSGKQTIKWQRCLGNGGQLSSKGEQDQDDDEGPTKNSKGVAMRDKWIAAPANDAMMVVEVRYDYTPLFSLRIAGYGQQQFTAKAARLVRDNRDLSGVQNPSKAKQALCPA